MSEPTVAIPDVEMARQVYEMFRGHCETMNEADLTTALGYALARAALVEELEAYIEDNAKSSHSAFHVGPFKHNPFADCKEGACQRVRQLLARVKETR